MPTAVRRLTSRPRLLITFIAALFAIAVFLHQMYFATKVQAVGSPTLVISQVYGGGGSTSTSPTPSFKNDYIEIFNRSGSNVTITNWSVQYQSAAGTSNWSVTAICSTGCTIGAGKYF